MRKYIMTFWIAFLSIPYPIISFGQSYITFEQFGVKANGSDETDRMIQAFDAARRNGQSIQLQNNKTYKFSPQQTIDVTGIPAIVGNGTIDISGAGPNSGNTRMQYLLTVTGKKELLQPGVNNIVAGKNQITLKRGLSLAKGDVIFITSIEPLANNKRKYNRKGQRALVGSYDQSSGKLTIQDTFYFSINRATIWKNTKQPYFEIGSRVHFVTSPMNFMSCVQLVYAKGKISGSYDNFAVAGIYFRSSAGIVENATINLPVNKNNGYSYGVAVSDMSDVMVENCNIRGGRHTVCGTSGGLWTSGESGGNGTDKLGYPATLIVRGGVYQTTYDIRSDITEHLGTLDTHGSVYKVTISDCTVYGGISLGADYADVRNVIIYTQKKRAFNFGSDVNPGSDWGHYTLSDITINIDAQTDKALLFGKADVDNINLSRIKVQGANDKTVVADFKDYAPRKFNIAEMNILQHQSPKLWVNDRSSVSVEKSSFDKNAVKMIKRTPPPPPIDNSN